SSAADPLTYLLMRPALLRDQAVPIERGRSNHQSVVLFRKALHGHQALAASGRTPVPVRISRRSPVVDGDQVLRLPYHLMQRALGEVEDQLVIERSVWIESEGSAGRSRMACVGARRRISGADAC